MNHEAASAASPSLEPTALNSSEIQRLLDDAGMSWIDLLVLDQTGSTNADLRAALAAGTARDGSVVVANTQTAGRGRLDRDWSSPPGGSLSWSVALAVPAEHAPFLPLLVGVAVARAVSVVGGLSAGLKWPNDVEVDGRKLAGLLSERVGDHVVVGCGINVAVHSVDLDVPNATSFSDHGVAPAREEILVQCLVELSRLIVQWRAASYSPVASGCLETYRKLCVSIGQDVFVSLPGDRMITGQVRDIDDHGRLMLVTSQGPRLVDAGDVTHLRAQG